MCCAGALLRPEVPVRQWVLSLPWALRYRLAYDTELTSAVLRIFVRRIFASLRRRARSRRAIAAPQCGSVTFVQRFGDALNLNVHFHSLVLDGVYDAGDGMRFHPLPPPDDAEVARVAASTARGISRLLARRGLGPEADPDGNDALSNDQPLLAALYSAAVRSRVAMGRRAGQGVLRFGDRVDMDHLPATPGPRCAVVDGVSLHANVLVPSRDRRRLERLCRYVARPPVATERLSRLDDGRLLYELRHRWRDGTTHVVFEPLELMERLAALVPYPRSNGVRYHGVLAPAARYRSRVVPMAAGSDDDAGAAVGARTDASARDASSARPVGPRPRNYSWAELMQRVFEVDVLECPDCQGRMRILAAIHPPHATRSILECLGLSSRAPPVAAAVCSSLDPWESR